MENNMYVLKVDYSDGKELKYTSNDIKLIKKKDYSTLFMLLVISICSLFFMSVLLYQGDELLAAILFLIVDFTILLFTMILSLFLYLTQHHYIIILPEDKSEDYFFCITDKEWKQMNRILNPTMNV
jgi:hypothetical protein